MPSSTHKCIGGTLASNANMKFRTFWNHPAGVILFIADSVGPKTVHFWAPAFKWGLVIAGLGDLKRPVESVSVFQSSGTSMFTSMGDF